MANEERISQHPALTSTISNETSSTFYDLPVIPLSDPPSNLQQSTSSATHLVVPGLEHPSQQPGPGRSLPSSNSIASVSRHSPLVSASSSVKHGIPGLSRPTPTISNTSRDRQSSVSIGIPSVKPVVDDHDRLWAEIDILNETESIAQQAALNKSFFGKDHAEALGELRKAQTELVRAMALGDKRMGLEQQYQNLWEQNDMESIRNNLFNQQHFNNVYNHVNRTIDKLDQVANRMKIVDEQSKEMWQSS